MAGYTNAIAGAAANLTSDTNANLSQEFVTAFLDDVKHRFDMAFQDLRKNVTNNERLLEFVRSYYENRLNTLDFYEAFQQHQNPTNNPLILERFFHNLSCFIMQHSMMKETLQSLDKTFTERLDWIDASKKASAVFFTAAVAICVSNTRLASVAAAAAVVLIELRKWIHSLMKKRESTIEKYRDITRVMTMGINMATKDLQDINVLSRQSVSENGGDHNSLTANLEELLEKADGFSRDMKWVKQFVLHTIIKCTL
ncbi:UPF0496 protein At4g34320-like [Salvia splendens]|uniref:UPF0496 protein At4g34320-like n=1 Tax=Salvia splendens TaxID=180675 RepID=UPI001C279BF1|nr:UPF0496 protein At4g34320-like [Salvia splendens]